MGKIHFLRVELMVTHRKTAAKGTRLLKVQATDRRYLTKSERKTSFPILSLIRHYQSGRKRGMTRTRTIIIIDKLYLNIN